MAEQQTVEPFVFLDNHSRPYLIREWGGDLWVFYWHADKKWVSLRNVDASEARGMKLLALPPEQAELYDDAVAISGHARGLAPSSLA